VLDLVAGKMGLVYLLCLELGCLATTTTAGAAALLLRTRSIQFNPSLTVLDFFHKAAHLSLLVAGAWAFLVSYMPLAVLLRLCRIKAACKHSAVALRGRSSAPERSPSPARTLATAGPRQSSPAAGG